MGSYKITGILIGVVLVGLFVSVISVYMASMSSNYGTEFSNSTLIGYDKLSTINTKMESVKEKTDIKEKSGIADVIGGYFSDAYNILTLTKDAFGYATDIIILAISQVGLGGSAGYFVAAAGAIVAIIIFLGIFVSAILNKDI